MNNHHIPKRNLGLARQLMDNCVELGADILEANEIYVGTNMHTEQRLANYAERIRIQDHARRLTYRMEHIFRVLHFAEGDRLYVTQNGQVLQKSIRREL